MRTAHTVLHLQKCCVLAKPLSIPHSTSGKTHIGSDKSRAFQNPPEHNSSSGKFSKNEQRRGVHKRVP